VVDHPLAGTDHVVRGSFATFPGVHAVLFAPAGRVSHRAGYTVGGAALVLLVLTRVVGFPSDAACDHGVVLTTFGGDVEQHGVVALVEVLLPPCLLGRGSTMVELGTLAGVGFLLFGSSGADQVGGRCLGAFVVHRSSGHTALAIPVEHTPLRAAEGDEGSCCTHVELPTVAGVRPEVRV